MEVANDALIKEQEKVRRPEFWRVLTRCAQVAILIDIAFFFLFHALGSPILAWVNIFSVAMYSVAYYALRKQKKSIAVALIWSEVMLHAGLGIILIGWDSGFHYYLLMFIPAICLSTSIRPALLTLTLLFAFYIGLDFLVWFIEPIQPINPLALKIVHIFNLSVVFVMFSYLSFFYLKMVRRAQKKLHIMATTDPLTELLNRRHMTYLADREVQRFNRTKHSIGILLIDIDFFKAINDQYGHKVGDDVLVKVAQIIKHKVRKQDLISRWGGEEFLIILPDTNDGYAQLSAERIRKAFVGYDWLKVIGEDISPTITTGVSELRQSESLSSAIARADRALYKGKAAGRNRVEFGTT
jgi:diguanylate cyclase (GGDEF)-like protein